MKETVDFSGFCDAFRNMDRNNNFSYEGKKMLFEYLEQYEEDCGTELELDVIAFCCEYNEDAWSDIASNYSIDLEDCDDDDSKIETVREYLEENTILIGEPESGIFLYQAF